MTSEVTPQPADDTQEHREVERKYDAGPDAGVPDFSILAPELVAGESNTARLVAEYVDTPERALMRARCVLRRRTGGEDAGWHLKTPGTGEARVEVHAPIGAPRRVPEALRARVADIVGDRPVLPAVELITVRTTTPILRARSGELVGYVCDDDVHARVLGVGHTRIAAWREIEIELAPGAPLPAIDEIAPSVRAAGFAPSPYLSKLERALEGVDEREVSGSTSGDAVLAAIAERLGQFQAWEARARVDAPDAVHRLRVALRRIRSLLKVYGRLFDQAAVAPLVEELRWAGGVLGAPRDAEVIRERLASEFAPSAPHDLDEWMESRHDAAFADFLREVDGTRWDALHLALTDLVLEPPFRKRARRRPERALAKLARAAGDRVLERAELAEAAESAGAAAAWHEVRKAAKGARYAFEALDRAPGVDVAVDRARWKAVAELLGEVQDDAVAEEHVLEFARELRGEGGAAVPEFASGSATASVTDAQIAEVLTRIRRHRADALAQAREAVRSTPHDREGPRGG